MNLSPEHVQLATAALQQSDVYCVTLYAEDRAGKRYLLEIFSLDQLAAAQRRRKFVRLEYTGHIWMAV